jgi:hypothetical protein
MQLSDLQAEIGRLLSDPNNDRWPASVLTTRINLAQTEIQGYCNAVKTTETLTPVANQATLAVNANTMDIIRATKTLTTGDVVPFKGMSREELDFQYPTWKQWTSGEPITWWWDGSNQQINLVPVPDASNAITNGITVWEIRKPADLAASTDIPFDSNTGMIPYHLAICHWVAAYCFMDNGTAEALAKSKFHRSGSMQSPGQYELELKRIMEKFDAPEAIPDRILWKPEGGRTGSWGPSKAFPLS